MVVECKREKHHVQAHCCSKQKYLQSSRLVDLRTMLAGSFLVLGAVLCTGGCLPAPLTPIQQTPGALPTPVVTTRNVSGLGRVSPGGLCPGMRNTAVKLHQEQCASGCGTPASPHLQNYVHTLHTHTLYVLSYWIFCTELLLNIRICTVISFFLLVYLNASKFIQLGSSCP